MTKKLQVPMLVALVVLLAALACNGGQSAQSTPTLAAPAATNTPAANPTLAPTAGGPLATIGAPNAYSSPTPAPAATLTPMPTVNYPATITALAPTATPPGTTTTTGVNPSCKTLVEARALFGVDVTLVGTEPCAYTWTSPDGSYAPVNLAKDWIATTAQSDHIWIDDGNDTRVSAHAATFRMKSLNPGLTVDTQFDLELAFAALPQNNFAALVACHGCVNTHVVPTPSAGVSPCPVINSFTASTIAGGCLYKSLTTANFVIPSGWKALSGVPATWTMSGTLNNVTQVSLYKQ